MRSGVLGGVLSLHSLSQRSPGPGKTRKDTHKTCRFIQHLSLPSPCAKAEVALVTNTNRVPASWSTSDGKERKCLGAVNGTQLAGCLHSAHKAPGMIPVLHKQGDVVSLTYAPSTQEMKAGGSEKKMGWTRLILGGGRHQRGMGGFF